MDGAFVPMGGARKATSSGLDSSPGMVGRCARLKHARNVLSAKRREAEDWDVRRGHGI